METRIVLIYDTGQMYDIDVQVMEFETEAEALEFINANGIHKDAIFGMYEIVRKIQL